MSNKYISGKNFLFIVSTVFLGSVAHSSPSPGSDYFNVAQVSHTQDLIGAPLELANVILCHMNNIGLTEAPLNIPYIAWVEDALCSGDTLNPSIAVQARSGDPSSLKSEHFNRGRIQVSLSDNGQATVISHWDLRENGKAWAHIVYDTSQSATTNQMEAYVRIYRPEDFNHLYLLVVDEDTILFRLEETEIESSQISHFEGWSARIENANGYGRIKLNDETWSFGYNEKYFCRLSSKGNEYCFDRRISEAGQSVWKYYLFDLEGNRLSEIPLEVSYIHEGEPYDLNKIPGQCIDQRNHEPVSCDTEHLTHWLQDFIIPEDLGDGNVTAIIEGDKVDILAKWVKRDVFMKLTDGVTSTSEGLQIGQINDVSELKIRDLELLDPSDVDSSIFIGLWPSDDEFNINPRVIHGEVITD